jgi:hypothetical protein
MSLIEPVIALVLLALLTLLARERSYRLTSASLSFLTIALAGLLIYAYLMLGV